MREISIIRLPRSDNEAAFVLIRVSSTGLRPLDVKLLGTEGSESYAVSLRHDRVGSLRHQASSCTEAEWRLILENIFWLKPLEDIQIDATVDEALISIIVRRCRGGVTQRLGSFALSRSPDEEIELFDWCGECAATGISFQEELAISRTRIQKLDRALHDLISQLAELVQAKKNNDIEQLEKFCLLLNEKKAMIREQQTKLLAEPHSAAGVHDDPVAAKEAAAGPSTRSQRSTRRVPAISGAVKRKTRATAEAHQEPDVDDCRDAKPGSASAEPQQLAENMDVYHAGNLRTPTDQETKGGCHGH